jgi:hypothetical protein
MKHRHGFFIILGFHLFALCFTLTEPSAAGSKGVSSMLDIEALKLYDANQLKKILIQSGYDADDHFWIGDSRIVDLDGDGAPELVVSLDYSGRAFFNQVRIIWSDGRTQEIEVESMASLEAAIQDLDLDGKSELILNRALSYYLGANIPMPIWTAIYSLGENGEFTEQSAKFPFFYDNTALPEINQKLYDIKLDKKHLDNMQEIQVLEIQRDKLLRILGRDSNAGLASAVAWARDPDSKTRAMAVSVLSEIDNPLADQMLQKLAKDVAQEVRSAIIVVMAGKRRLRASN